MIINRPISNEGLYVYVNVEKAELRQIENVVNKFFNNLVNLNFIDPHITVLYSETIKSFEEVFPNFNTPGGNWICTLSSLEVIYGSNNNYYLIANVTSPYLDNLHNAFKQLGYNHSYPNYKCHITLVKDIDTTKFRRFKERLLLLNDFIGRQAIKLSFSEFIITSLKK